MFYGSEVIEVYDGHEDSALLLRRENDEELYTYRLGALPLPTGPYMFTVWTKSTHDVIINLEVLGKSEVFQITRNEWTKLMIENDSPALNANGIIAAQYVDITPMYYEEYTEDEELYFYQAMLEQSNKMSDWKPAPEDDQNSILQLTERVASAEIKLEDDNIVSTVMESQKFRSDMASVEETISSNVKQSVDALDVKFSSTKEYVDNKQSYIDEAESHMRFDADGIHMGKSNDPFTMDLSNTELAFNDNGNRVAYINNQTMHITNAEITSRMTVNGFAFIPTDTGMALVYVGN